MSFAFVLPDLGASVIQGWHGPWSHYRVTDRVDMTYAVDFLADPGTDVLAAREGTVWGAVDFYDGVYEGLEAETGLRVATNFVVLDHGDSMTLYSHLKKDSAQFRMGDAVLQGQVIAQTGLSGWVGLTPHLHFAVIKREDTGNRSIRFRFDEYNSGMPLEHSSFWPS